MAERVVTSDLSLCWAEPAPWLNQKAVCVRFLWEDASKRKAAVDEDGDFEIDRDGSNAIEKASLDIVLSVPPPSTSLAACGLQLW